MRQHAPPQTVATAPALLRWSGWTDCGKVRSNNEDSFLGIRFDSREVQHLGKTGEASLEGMDLVFAVSDGMGGARAGEFASRIAVEKITTLLPRAFKQTAAGFKNDFPDVLTELYAQIHRALVFVGESYDECRGMETTLSLCWFTPGWMCFGHIGDSRIYHLPKGSNEIKQLSHDDTHVGWLRRTGQINDREARTHPRRNVLQKALGGTSQFVDPQVGAVAWEPGDIFLLCTDGLVDGLYDNHLPELVRPASPALPDGNVARGLVEASLANSGSDNTTALVIEVV